MSASPRRPHIATTTHLSDSEQAEVTSIATSAQQADGTFPLDGQVLLDLGSDDFASHRHLTARWSEGGSVIGYAHLDTRSPEWFTAHLVVQPDERRHGVGTALISAVSDQAPARDGIGLKAWSHGDHPAAAALARSLRWARVRDLWQMQLSFETPIGQPAYPDDVEVRTFEPGKDEQAWVEVNAAAFAHHPEQGRMTIDDLRQREQQPWFDPSGIFLAIRGDEVLGSHWTKVHVGDDGRPVVGEVYVVGVRPSAQGLGLGKALTLTGLRHLRTLGLDVMLYADADNDAAVAVYQKLGFVVSKVDVMYARPTGQLEQTERLERTE